MVRLGAGVPTLVVYPDSSKTRDKFLVFFGLADSAGRMIRGGFLTEEDRGKLVALVRDGSAASRVTPRAHALADAGQGIARMPEKEEPPHVFTSRCSHHHPRRRSRSCDGIASIRTCQGP